MKRITWLVALAMLLLSWERASAAVWNVVQNKDCTGLADATVAGQGTNTAWCCLGNLQGFCNKRMNFGDLFEVIVTLVATGNYTTNGDTLTNGEIAKMGLNTLVRLDCQNVTTLTDPPIAPLETIIRRTAAASPSFSIEEIIQSTGLQTTGASSIAGHTTSCIAWGY